MQFGFCTKSGCDWNAYWKEIIKNAIGAWVMMGIIFFVLFLYICFKAIRRCCRHCKGRDTNKPMWKPHWIPRAHAITLFFVILSILLSFSALVAIIVAWCEMQDTWSRFPMDDIFMFVETLNRVLVTFNANTLAVDKLQSNVDDVVRILRQFYLFVLIPVCVATALLPAAAFLFLIQRRRSPKCTFVLALLALLVNVGVWAILGVLYIGQRAAGDLHSDFLSVLGSFQSVLTNTYDAAQNYLICNNTCAGNCSVEYCFCDCLVDYFGNQSQAYAECMVARTPLRDTLNGVLQNFSSCVPFQVTFLLALTRRTSDLLSGYRLLTAAVVCVGTAGALIAICLIVFTEWFLGGKHFRTKGTTKEELMGATEEPTERLDSMEGMKGEEDGLKTVPQEADLTYSTVCCEPPADTVTPATTPVPAPP
eukprot:EG_transcript_7707